MNVIPFRGYRYNSDVVGDVGACISPPYDVIDPDQQQELHDRNPRNIVRVIKGIAQADDNDQSNVYTRAAASLRDFIEQKALIQDDRDSVYVYAQDFTIGDTCYRRTGFVALGELEDYGGNIKPHEQTLAGPKADRLNLMRATHAQVGQIFMLYSDPEKRIDAILAKASEIKALVNYSDDEGVVHRLFRVDDPADLAIVAEVMKDKNVFIADGHHRYETALNYHREKQTAASAYRMMTFVNTHNEGLVVLPTHRLVKNVANFDAIDMVSRMREQFDVGRMPFSDIVGKKAKMEMMFDALRLDLENGLHAIGFYLADEAFYVATLRDGKSMDDVAADHSEAWRGLDVAILHKLILERLLGIDDAALTAQTNCEYIKDFGQATLHAVDAVDEGRAQALFFLNETPADQVEKVALAGEKMPQKSTFFYPKIFSGLVLNVLE